MQLVPLKKGTEELHGVTGSFEELIEEFKADKVALPRLKKL